MVKYLEKALLTVIERLTLEYLSFHTSLGESLLER